MKLKLLLPVYGTKTYQFLQITLLDDVAFIKYISSSYKFSYFYYKIFKHFSGE